MGRHVPSQTGSETLAYTIELDAALTRIDVQVCPRGFRIERLNAPGPGTRELLEAAGAHRGLRSRLSAWLGLGIVFALYFPGHAAPQNLFGSVFAAFFIALFVGGGGGLFLGEFAARRARS